jgi:hypothetical protein
MKVSRREEKMKSGVRTLVAIMLVVLALSLAWGLVSNRQLVHTAAGWFVGACLVCLAWAVMSWGRRDKRDAELVQEYRKQLGIK